MKETRSILILALATLLLLASGCSSVSPVEIDVELLRLVILEHKDDSGRYMVLQQEESTGKTKPYPSIDKIKYFDEIYKEGQRYQIIVKRVKEEGKVRYLWTEKYW